MLTHLAIRNIALIEALELNFSTGFTALTGETGAGKSILLGALGLSLGERMDTRLLPQSGQGSVSAAFDISKNKPLKAYLTAHDMPVEDTLILRRVAFEDGKNRAYINGETASQAQLKTVGDMLVEIHGQHDQRGLMNPASHITLLDNFANLSEPLTKTSAAYRAWNAKRREVEALRLEIERLSREASLLEVAAKDLSALAPQPGEEAMLTEKRARLSQGDKVRQVLENALKELQGTGKNSALDTIHASQRTLTRTTAPLPEATQPIIEGLERAGLELSEAIDALDNLLREDRETESLDAIEDRLFALRAAARKYGKTIEELPAYRDEVAQQISLLSSQDDTLKKAQHTLKALHQTYVEFATQLSQLRRKAATKLEAAIASELKPLKMEHSTFQVLITPRDAENWQDDGMDKVEFMVRTNPGSPFGPLSKIASGGELSRFMLALKVASAGVDSVGTLMFDEVDTGVGGAVADAIGKRLSILGKSAQVLAITHHPQVAARADHHILVAKTVKKNTTEIHATILNDQARQEELARMLSGEAITEASRAAAASLMEAS